jgi:hypothetical protein
MTQDSTQKHNNILTKHSKIILIIIQNNTIVILIIVKIHINNANNKIFIMVIGLIRSLDNNYLIK